MFKIGLVLLSLSLLVNTVLLVLYKNERSVSQVLKSENVELKLKLNQLTEEHVNLKRMCELDKQKIEQNYKKLLQKAIQKPKTIEIPVFIEKPVYIPTEDCQRLGVMIDEALELINSQ